MLEELHFNAAMANQKKHHLSIHHSNLFHPKPTIITNSTLLPTSGLLAITKKFSSNNESNDNRTINLIEIYKTFLSRPKLLTTIVEYEQITGLAWFNEHYLLTTSEKQTICIYDIRTEIKVYSTLTDYGAIKCMKLSSADNLLITGTEYGYVITYNVSKNGDETFSVEPMNKMVKINGGIKAVDFAKRPREQVAPKKKQLKKTKPVKLGKRKRSETSSSSSESDSDQDEEEVLFLGSFEVTIYGATGREVVVWDYHRKTITDTIKVGDDDSCCVNSIVALSNGDLITGDSIGTLNIFDHMTLTCKQSLNVSDSSILCVSKNHREDCLAASGVDPAIVILHKDKTTEDRFVVFEKAELHDQGVTCLSFASKSNFFSGSLDGTIGRFRLKIRGKKELCKSLTSHNYSNCIKFSNEQMMLQHERSLIIWKFTKLGSEKSDQESLENEQPKKILLLKTKEFIHSSTFSDKWIAYSTKRGVHIFDRTEATLKSYGTDVRLPGCNSLEICFNNKYLAAGQMNKVYLISLDRQNQEEDQETGTDHDEIGAYKFSVVAEKVYDTAIKQILDFKPLNKIVVACFGTTNSIHIHNLSSDPSDIFTSVHTLSFAGYKASFMTYGRGNKVEKKLYIYTDNDIIIRADLKGSVDGEEELDLEKCARVQDLPEEVNIKGMIVLSKDHCIIYDNEFMFKVDVKANKVLNRIRKIGCIVSIDNFVFNDANELAIVELPPDGLKKAQPPTNKYKQKYGT